MEVIMILQLLITYLFFALSLISVSSLMNYFTAAGLTAIRLAGSGIVLTLIGACMAKKETWHRLFSPQIMGGLVFLALGNVLSINILLSLALATTSACIVGLLYNTNPLMVAVFASMLGMEKLTQRKILSLIGGFVGLLVIMLPEIVQCGSVSSGQLYAFAAAVIAAISALVMKQLSTNLDKDGGFLLIGLSMILGGSVGFLVEPISTTMIMAHAPLIVLSIATTGLAAICYYFLLASYPASIVTMASFTTPLFLAIFEFILYGRVPAFATILGGGIVLLALYNYVE
jgi:drug/metabolite transporter (DMT)-like permease